MLLELGLEIGDLALERLHLGQQGLHNRAHPRRGGVPLRWIDPQRQPLVAHRASMAQPGRVVKLADQSRPAYEGA